MLAPCYLPNCHFARLQKQERLKATAQSAKLNVSVFRAEVHDVAEIEPRS